MADAGACGIGREEGAKVSSKKKPSVSEPRLLNVKELADRWGIGQPAVKVRLRKYSQDIQQKVVKGTQMGMAVTEQEADRVLICVLDAVNRGQKTGGRNSNKRNEVKVKRHRERKENSMRYFAEHEDDFAFPDKSRYRQPGEIVKIIGMVTKRPEKVCCCDDCTEHATESFGDERYIGCRHGMLSMHPDWEHKRGVKLFRDICVQTYTRNADGVEVPGKVEVFEGIRRSEVNLYDACRWYKEQKFVDKSRPINDNPTAWEVEPETEEDEDSDV